jgi:hypothetical protein
LACPVAVTVAKVRPWKLVSKQTNSKRPGCPRACWALRASFSSASLASAPELQKKARSSPESEVSSSARVTWGSV